MNAFAVFILIALLAEYGLNRAADLLNIRALQPEVPDEFRDLYDADTYRRSQEYTRARTRFGFVPATFDLATVLAFWFLGGFAWLDGWVRGFELGPVWTGLSFIGVLLIGKSILGLPFSWYSTFVIEERFGFNKTTPKTFWADVVKGLVLGVLIGGPLLAAILAFFAWAGGAAWLWCWGMTTAFAVVLQFVAPTWIMPLFNKFTPLEEGELRERVLAYADSVSFPLKGMFVIDGSRRSTKANAFFTGFGRNKRIALFDTLIEKHETDELVAVVAHEIGHYKKKHVLVTMAISILHMGVIFGLLAFFLPQQGLFDAFGLQQPSVYAGLVFFGLLYAPVELVLAIGMQAFSRRNEYEADRYAAQTTGLWQDLSAGLKKLSADSLSNLTPHPFYVTLHYSHPPVLQRIDTLRREWGGS
ncbi:MAG: M48 family metallopeptidase [Planctomycetota bacterium]|nr:M48 family metallopeptidase [Planctomycetota bacterium]